MKALDGIPTMSIVYWRSAGLLTYRWSEGRLLWLLIDSRLSQAGSAWEFPKGLIEPGEEPVAAAIRECAEESGVRVDRVAVHPGFHESIQWTMHRDGQMIHRVVDYYLARTNQTETSGDWEVREVRWVTTKETLLLLRHEDLRKLLSLAVYYVEDEP